MVKGTQSRSRVSAKETAKKGSTSNQDQPNSENITSEPKSGLTIPNFANLPPIPPSFEFGVGNPVGFGYSSLTMNDPWSSMMGTNPSYCPFPGQSNPFQLFHQNHDLSTYLVPPGFPGLFPGSGFPFGEMGMSPPPRLPWSSKYQIAAGAINLPTPWGPPEMNLTSLLSSIFPVGDYGSRDEFQNAMAAVSKITTENRASISTEQPDVNEFVSDDESDNESEDEVSESGPRSETEEEMSETEMKSESETDDDEE